MSSNIEFITLDEHGPELRIEYQWLGNDNASAPLIVFLHEGLGSLAMWRDFPERLCGATGCRGLVYSRPGYGRSSPRRTGENWDRDFMHLQAHSLLPALLAALAIDTLKQPPWLFGHSDGATIALLYAARFPGRIAAAMVLAPHIMVEELTLDSIEQARVSYLKGELKQKLGSYHDDPDSAFWGWNDIWLHASFRKWSIEAELASIRCPLLVVQGIDDEYGTLEQVRGIARRVEQAKVVELADCGHSPQRDQAEALIALTTGFMAENLPVATRKAMRSRG